MQLRARLEILINEMLDGQILLDEARAEFEKLYIQKALVTITIFQKPPVRSAFTETHFQKRFLPSKPQLKSHAACSRVGQSKFSIEKLDKTFVRFS